MPEKSKSPPADEAAPSVVDSVHGSEAIYDAETRPNATSTTTTTTAAEMAGGESDEITARPPPTMTPSQRLAVLVAQTRLRAAQSAAESGPRSAVQLATKNPEISLAPVGSPVSSGGGAAPAAVTTPGVPAVPQWVEGEPTEKDDAPREQVVAPSESAAIPPETPGSGRGLRVGLVAVLVGGLAWLAFAWIVPRFRETRAPQAPEPSVQVPSPSSTAVDLTPRQPSTPPTGAPAPAAPAIAAPAVPAAPGPAERAAEPGAHAPSDRSAEEELSPDRPSPPQPASAKAKHDSARAQAGPVRSSNSRAAHTRAKTKAAGRPSSTSKKDPDDVLPLRTP